MMLAGNPFGGTAAPVPGRIEFENYDLGGESVAYHDTTTANEGTKYRTSEAVDVESTTDTGGGYDVGWAHAGEWINYTVNVASAGTYNLDVRAANVGTGGAFHIEVDGANVTGTLAVPNTGGFQTYTDILKNGISLSAGQHVVRLAFDGNSAYGFSGNFNWMQFTAVAPTAPSVTVAASSPNASEQGPTNGAFTFTRTGDTSQALTVNYLLSGLATPGSDYQNNLTGTVTFTAGSSTAIATVTPIDDAIVEGTETVIVTLQAGTGYTLGAQSAATVSIADNDTAPPGASTPFGGTAAVLPGAIEIENFDLGGEGVAYHDTTVANEGGAYRTAEGVDVEPTGDAGGGYDVGWAHAGEWMKYTVNVGAAGNYDLATRVANYGTGGAFHIEVDGVNVTGTLAVPNTGGFQTYTDVVKSGIALTAGQHVLTLVMDGNSAYGFTGNFNRLTWTSAAVALPVMTVTATQPNASEQGPVSGVFTVTRSGNASAALSIPYILSGTATNGSDYSLLSGSIAFTAGQTTATVTLTPIDDALVEGTEFATLTLVTGTGYTVGVPASATVNIADNDSAPTGSTPFSGAPIALPGLIEAENYDKGGEGIAYHDTTANNEGLAYRTSANEGVDVESTGDAGGGYDVGWAHAGEWMKYTVTVGTSGNYNLDVRAANLGTGGAFHIEVDGVNVTGSLAVPNTGAFQAYTDVLKSGIALTAGQHVITLAMDGNSAYGFSGNFNWIKFTAATITTTVPPAGAGWVTYAQMTGQDLEANQYPAITGAGIGVAVIDRGIDYNAPQIGAAKIVYGYNFRDGNTNTLDDYGHGTGVAGIIAASGYNYGTQYNQGIAPNVNLISLKQESSAGVKAALDWVIANHSTYNIQVVNLTDFITDVLPGAWNPSIYQSELQTLHDMGIFVSTPAGNGESLYGPNASMTLPGLSPYLTTVSGFDQAGAYFADALRGPAVDILGPSNGVTMPYYLKNANATGYDQYDDNYTGTPTLVNYAVGTSWASAYVSGAAALIKQVNPNFTVDQIRQILTLSGTSTLDPTNNVYVPRLNIGAAVALAQQWKANSGIVNTGVNVDASKIAGSESTGQIAVNPVNSNNLVIVSQSGDNGGALLPLSRSFDGGKTWVTTLVGTQDGQPANSPRPDAHVAFDSFGNLYLTYMVGGTAGETRIAVVRSIDGGASFSTLGFAVSGTGFDPDAPWIATGRDAANGNLQHVWISFTDYKTNRVMIVGGTASAAGQFSGWSTPKTVSKSFGTYSSVAVNAAGQLAVAWQSSATGQGPNSLMLNADSTGTGNSFGADQFLASTNVGGFDYIPAQPNRSIDAEPRLAFDRSGGVTNGRLYAVYTDESGDESNNTDIYLKYSDNLGASWSAAVKVNDDNSGRSQFIPAIAVDQTTGNVGLSWMDARNSASNTGAQLFATVSLDHGASVQPNVRVSDGVSYQAGANPNSNDLDFGDNGGLVFNAGKLIPVWSDNANGTFDNAGGTGKSFDIYTDVLTVA